MRCLALLVLVGCHGDPVKCEKGIRNYAQLVFWHDADLEIAASPPDKRDALRKDKLAKFEHDMEVGLPTAVSKCTSANSDDELNCMLAAKTSEQAHACSK